MGVNIQKQQATKPAPSKQKDQLKPPQSVLTQDEMKMVDELAQISAEIEAVKPKLKRYEELKQTLQSVADAKFDQELPAVLKGEIGVAEYSAKGNSRSIKDMNEAIGALKAKLGYDKLIELIKINLGDLDKYLTKEETAPLIQTGKGSRSLKSVRFKD